MSGRTGIFAFTLALCIAFGALGNIAAVHAEGPRQVEHIILVIIDGVRSDILLQADTPTFDMLAGEGSYTWNAWTVFPSETGYAIPSLLAGSTPDVHNAAGFQYWSDVESIFEVFERSGLPTAVIGGSTMTYSGIEPTYSTGYYYRGDQDAHSADLAIEWLVEHKPFLIYVYNPVPDRMGHAHGHDSAEYRGAIENADYHISRLVQALKDQGVYDRTLIVITTDHGMTGTSHSHGYETDMRIFSIWHGPGVKRGYEMVGNVYIAASATHGETHVAHRIIDIAPTLVTLADLSPPARWNGEVIWQILAEPAEAPGGISWGLIAVPIAVVITVIVIAALRDKRFKRRAKARR